MKITLDELQAFIAVVDTGSISRAAEQLGQTVSGASRALGRLEEKLGTTLLRRTTRRLELTEEGLAFLERARAIVASVEEAEEHMAARQDRPAGRLRVDAATPFMLHVIVPIVAGYRERYPDVELELVSNEGITDLLERRTDVAIRIGRLKDSSLHARPIGSSRLRVLASPAYLETRGRPRGVADLASHTLLGFNQPESLNQWPLRDRDDAPMHVRPDIRSSSGETLRQLALALQHITAARSIVFIGLLPLATAIFGALRGGERPRPAFWLFAVLGSACVAGFALSQDAQGMWQGDLLMLAAVVVCGYGYAEGGRLSRHLGGWQVICWSLALSLPLMAAWTLASPFPAWRQVGVPAWTGLAYVSLFSMLIGFVFWYRGLAQGGIAAVGQLQLLQPFMGLALAAGLLGEPVDRHMLAATLGVVLCVAGARKFSAGRAGAPTPGFRRTSAPTLPVRTPPR